MLGDDGFYTLDYAVLVSPLIGAAKELKIITDNLESRVSAVESGAFTNGINIAPIVGGSATERAIQIGNGWDSNIYFDDTTANVQVANGGTLTFEDADGTDLISASKTTLAVNLDDTTSYSEKLCHSGIDGEQESSLLATVQEHQEIMRNSMVLLMQL